MYVFSPPLLFGLQLLGLLPVSVNHLPLRGDIASFSWTRVMYSILLVICYCLIFCCWFWKYTDDRHKMYKTTFLITSMCSSLSSFIGAVTAEFVAATSSNQKILLVEKLREVDFLLQHKLGPSRTRRVPLLLLGTNLALTTVGMAFILYYDFDDSKYLMTVTNCVFEYFKIVIHLGLLEVMEIVLAVRERFQLVNERVLEVVMRSHSKLLMWTVALPCVETFTMPQEVDMSIHGLSEIHWRLCCIVYDINGVYGRQLVTAMMYIFAHLVYSPYLLFVFFNDGVVDTYFIVFTLMWILLHVSELYVLVFPCSLTVREAKKTVTIVAKLMGNRVAKPIFHELETFADQLFHRDVEFTACGLFTLQTSIIISVASAVTTYMAIIIQFQTSTDDDNTSTESLPVTTATLVVHH